jgi:ATP-dependent DNA helicase RecQ
MDRELIDITYNKIRNGKVKILFIAGERLESKMFLSVINNIDISLIVFDEAHTLLWSEDFRKSLKNIKPFIESRHKRPKMLALTATATSDTVRKIKDIAGFINPEVIAIECDRKNIYYEVIKTNNKNKELIKYLSKHKKEKGIIYCLTIRNVEYVYSFLLSMGFDVTLYHGALDNIDKVKNQNDFVNGIKNIIVASNAFGMGIDIKDIRYVIDYDMPASIEDFSQQSGRASRDGEYAEGIIFFDRRDIETINYFIDNIENEDKKEEERIKRDRRYKLDKMISLTLSYKCMHQGILEYFGFKSSKCNNMCYICRKK